MKKAASLILTLMILAVLAVPAFAADPPAPNILNASTLDIHNTEVEQMIRERAFYLSDATKITSVDQLVRLLRESVRSGRNYTLICADPGAIPIENEEPGQIDLNPAVYDHFHYGYNGGLFTEQEYCINSGPSAWYTAEGENGWKYYSVVFQYCTNNEERAQCDAKLRGILSAVSGETPAKQLKHFYDWMKTNLPAKKISTTGYPRNCNGLYGALFGDGTGYVCATYCETIQRFAEIAGIESRILSGAYIAYDEPCHAINVVKLDGLWYAIDYTTDSFLVPLKETTMYGTAQHYMANYPLATKPYDLSAGPVTSPDDGDPIYAEPVENAVSKRDAVTVTMSPFKTTLNGRVWKNDYATYPLLFYKNITYFPMTWYECRFLGLTTGWDNATRTFSVALSSERGDYRPMLRSDKNKNGYSTALIVRDPIVVNGKTVDNTKEEYPLLNFRGVTYFPMIWKFCVDEFGWNYTFSLENGLSISVPSQKQ